VLAVLVAAAGGTAASKEPDTARRPPSVAIVAGADATPAALAAASARAHREGATHVVVRRAGGLLDAEGEATALAAEGYDVVVAAGGQGRTAVGQAAASELAGGTRWVTAP
jgi:hypothetical protein